MSLLEHQPLKLHPTPERQLSHILIEKLRDPFVRHTMRQDLTQKQPAQKAQDRLQQAVFGLDDHGRLTGL